MSTPINGVEPGEWAKHLRPYGKKAFWKAHRQLSTDTSPEYTDVASEIKPELPSQAKPYGIKLMYHMEMLGVFGTPLRPHEFCYHKWYKTKKSRDAAFRNLEKKSSPSCQLTKLDRNQSNEGEPK